METSGEPQAAPQEPGVASLQFDKAEFEDPRAKCTLCATPIDASYYHLSGEVICPTCAAQFEAGQQRPLNQAVFRGALWGFGAAVACGIGYSIITLVTGYEFALAAIAVGYLVGRAVRKGSRGLGGRRCQALAVVLTYFAVTSSYVPLIIKQINSMPEQRQGAPAKPAAPAEEKTDVTAAGVATAIVFLFGLAMAAPFLELTSGFSGLLTVAIIFFGLQQAWRQTARDPRCLMGPYSTAEEPLNA